VAIGFLQEGVFTSMKNTATPPADARMKCTQRSKS